MWRFILLTFAFLGWSFFELSGGFGYQPAANSIQAQVRSTFISPVSRPGAARKQRLAKASPAQPTIPAADPAIITPAHHDPTADPGTVPAPTLASVQTDTPTVQPDPPETKAALLTEPASLPAATIDLSQVSGTVANMRGGPGITYGTVAKLAHGTQVSILQNTGSGWLELQVVETGQTGWIAEWLVSDAVY